jgi:hypothetical protein
MKAFCSFFSRLRGSGRGKRAANALAAALLAVSGGGALAQEGADAERVGTVKVVTGQAFVVTGLQRAAAFIGAPVYPRSRLVTGPGSTLGVTFKDETSMSIGPDSQLTIDPYLFSPRHGQAGIAASLLRGTLSYVSGLIAKMRPEAVNVTTPTAIIGVRGTQFVVRVDP